MTTEKVGDVFKELGELVFPSEEECEKRRQEYELSELAKKQFKENWKFKRFCPPMFQKTDRERLPETQLSKCLQWVQNMDGKGLVLHGVTGTCKTRCSWEIIRECVVLGKSWRFYTACQLQQQLSDSFQNGGHGRLKRDVIRTGVLVIDDLDKAKMTERWETDLFDIIDNRLSWEKPIIISMNTQGDGLVDSFSDKEKGTALVRRIRDYCQGISF